MAREKMDFDVVIVGGGPAGLAAAIRLAQMNKQDNKSFSICLIDKGDEIGAHLLSGAALEPRALNELIPDWQNLNPPTFTPIIQDKFLWLTERKSFRVPTPPQMRNDGNYIISLGQFCRFLSTYAESLGVNIFPGFAASDVIYENEQAVGIITGDKGMTKSGEKTSQFQEGMELRAKYIFLAEGCRGSLTQNLFKKFNLRAECDPQTYGLGIKEVWEYPEGQFKDGVVIHTVGWPLDLATYGGSFVYFFGKKYLSLGYVIGLDYKNPYLNPYEEFQRFKKHPAIVPYFENAKRIAYGARALNEGGFQSIPKLTFPGGLIIGCAAGFLNVPKIKGIHNAMKSGMVAAESVFKHLMNSNHPVTYEEDLKKSWVYEELYTARNIRPAFKKGLLKGLVYSAIDTFIFRGKAPWTFHNHADHSQLQPAKDFKPIHYPKHDNIISFDLPSSVYLTHVKYEENQPCHLKLKDPSLAIEINYKEYASPESRYCPAGVYEILNKERQPHLQINFTNCIQCKACDIKDPTQNIVWTPPEGGDGPQYRIM